MGSWARGGTRRRRIPRVLPILVVGLALLAGCTDTPPPPLVPVSASRALPTGPTDTSQVVVGVDNINGGYNPHAIADQSPITTTLASMLLPSVFQIAPDGTPELDQNLMTSAQVTSAAPFTVTYSVRTDASWSDGTPVDAADFVYLRDQMSTQPGVLDAAGYQLISNIVARDNGKTIQVTFSKPYPGWRSLFGDLLPAHLLKDAPGGWNNALVDSFPATAGPFQVQTLDQGAGQIVLQRSDRYWGKPTQLDEIVLTKTDSHGIADALRSGSDQLAYANSSAAGLTLLQQLGGVVSLNAVAQPQLATVLLRPSSTELANPVVRAAVLAALNRAALISAGTGGGPAAQQVADDLVLAPSMAGYAATMPTTGQAGAPNPTAVNQLLTQAGYTKPVNPPPVANAPLTDPTGSSGGSSTSSSSPAISSPTTTTTPPQLPASSAWTRGGQPLRLVVAAPAGATPFVDIAQQIVAELTSAGIQATLSTPAGNVLYGQQVDVPPPTNGTQTTTPPPDILVGPQAVGGDSATDLASQFGCQQTLPNSTNLAPPNAFGWCDSALQPTIESALTGEMTLSDVLAKVEPVLWADDVEVPLFQFSTELAVGTKVTGVGVGAPLAGPFVGSPNWNTATT
ncbi:MAG TPA: ABC transporter family substrate-binding protein [Pseudonocardiaceae bacterium]|nr:ABC transporter family substrate-binding protein [Pseudonocardiaceae bacterium]